MSANRTVRFLRHAESAANAGEATTDPASIPLTPAGHEAAADFADAWSWPAPNLIVVSPFLRAEQTAAPIRRAFPGTPAEVWPVEEFTYLDPAAHRGTTVAERRSAVVDYWQNAKPDDAASNAESLSAFLDRVHHCLLLLAGREATRALVVSHEMVIQAARWLIEVNPDPQDETLVRRFADFRAAHPISNLGIWELDLDDDRLRRCVEGEGVSGPSFQIPEDVWEAELAKTRAREKANALKTPTVFSRLPDLE